MPDYLDIARAARRAGVSRREIQRRIAAGELESFEGKVAYAGLLRLYPEAARVPAGMVEFVAEVKEAAVVKAPAHEDVLPPSEVLAQRYREVLASRDRAEQVARERLTLLNDTERILARVAADGATPQRLAAALQWLRAQLRRGGVG